MHHDHGIIGIRNDDLNYIGIKISLMCLRMLQTRAKNKVNTSVRHRQKFEDRKSLKFLKRKTFIRCRLFKIQH